MPQLTRTFRTRGYELDRSGRIGAAQFARYLEHLRWEALADPTVALGRLFSHGNHLVVRAQSIDLLKPTHHDEDLVATLDVTRVGRTSLSIGHTVYRSADGTHVARGEITGVFIDGTGTPQPIPDDVRSLAPATAPAPAPAPAPATAPAPAPAPEIELPIIVRPSDTDLLQHVNHARYIDYFDDARTNAARASAPGFPGADNLVLTHFQISYDTEAVSGDTLALRLAKSTDAPLTFTGTLHRSADARVLARAHLVLGPV
ncbi:MAG: thioesterase family protein [Deltaproteobacteria bacterium]|nr:thioesterase family protein [Deltaproteobacteria bacterium]